VSKPSDVATAPLVVLVVEDDPADVELIQDAFTQQELPSRLHHVPDGDEALAFLRHEDPYGNVPRPDLILLDLNVPRIDGRHVLTEVKSDATLTTIPVIVFTTSTKDTDVRDSYGAHANAYITKPIDLEDFDRAIGSVLSFFGSVVTLPPSHTR
jgi:CheY-like chemotaxis protein